MLIRICMVILGLFLMATSIYVLYAMPKAADHPWNPDLSWITFLMACTTGVGLSLIIITVFPYPDHTPARHQNKEDEP